MNVLRCPFVLAPLLECSGRGSDRGRELGTQTGGREETQPEAEKSRDYELRFGDRGCEDSVALGMPSNLAKVYFNVLFSSP